MSDALNHFVQTIEKFVLTYHCVGSGHHHSVQIVENVTAVYGLVQS